MVTMVRSLYREDLLIAHKFEILWPPWTKYNPSPNIPCHPHHRRLPFQNQHSLLSQVLLYVQNVKQLNKTNPKGHLQLSNVFWGVSFWHTGRSCKYVFCLLIPRWERFPSFCYICILFKVCNVKLQSFGYDVSYHNYTWERCKKSKLILIAKSHVRTPKLSGRVHLDNHVVSWDHTSWLIFPC